MVQNVYTPRRIRKFEKLPPQRAVLAGWSLNVDVLNGAYQVDYTSTARTSSPCRALKMMRGAVLGLQRALPPRCCGSTRLAVRARHDDWMAAAEREARAHRPGKGGDGLSAVQRHLMDSLDYEIKGEMMAQTVRLEEWLTAAVLKLTALRVQAQAESSLVGRYNLERSTARMATRTEALTPTLTLYS